MKQQPTELTLKQQLAALEAVPGWIELASQGNIPPAVVAKIRRQAQQDKLWIEHVTGTKLGFGTAEKIKRLKYP